MLKYQRRTRERNPLNGFRRGFLSSRGWNLLNGFRRWFLSSLVTERYAAQSDAVANSPICKKHHSFRGAVNIKRRVRVADAELRRERCTRAQPTVVHVDRNLVARGNWSASLHSSAFATVQDITVVDVGRAPFYARVWAHAVESSVAVLESGLKRYCRKHIGVEAIQRVELGL